MSEQPEIRRSFLHVRRTARVALAGFAASALLSACTAEVVVEVTNGCGSDIMFAVGGGMNDIDEWRQLEDGQSQVAGRVPEPGPVSITVIDPSEPRVWNPAEVNFADLPSLDVGVRHLDLARQGLCP